MIRGKRKIWVILWTLAAWMVLFANIDLGQAKDPDYPTKPIEFYIGMSPGGSTDLACRGLITPANKYLAQPFVPINKAGGGGTIAVMGVLTAKPDGYTIGACSSAQAVAAPLSGLAPYKDITGFTWITRFGGYITPLLCRSDAPWKDFKDFIAWARENPRAVKIATTAARNVDIKGFILWQVEKREQVEFTYVPFKGGADAVTSLLGGHTNASIVTTDATSASYITEGKLRILAYLAPHKVSGFENVPSLKEMYGIDMPDFLAIYGPKGLPGYVVKKLEGVFAKSVKDSDFKKIMDRMFMPVSFMNGAQCKEHVDGWYSKIGKIYEQMKADEEGQKK